MAYSDEWIVAKKDAARFFGVSVQALDGWINRGCPVHERDSAGRIRSMALQAMHDWRVSRAEEGLSQLDEERTRLTRAQANKCELEVDHLKGVLVASDAIQQEWLESVAAARSKLLAMPTRIATVAMAATSLRDIEDAVRREIYAALNELADESQCQPAPEEDSAGSLADVAPAAALNG